MMPGANGWAANSKHLSSTTGGEMRRTIYAMPLWGATITLVPVTRWLAAKCWRRSEIRTADYLMRIVVYQTQPALIRMALKFRSSLLALHGSDVCSGIGKQAIVWHKGEAVYGPEWGGSFTTEAFRLFKQLEGLPPDQQLDIYRHPFTEDWVKDIESESD